MKYFPLKVAILCLILTPVLYIATLNLSQNYLNDYYFQNIENTFIGDSSNLLSGRISIEEQIANNIDTYLKKDKMVRYFGLDAKIFVTTKQGKVIYPIFINADVFVDTLRENNEFRQIAKQNFEILNSGLKVSSVEINLNHGTRIANLILGFYLCIAILTLVTFYKKAGSKAKYDAQIKKDLIDNLQKDERIQQQILEDMKKERQGLFENIKSLNAKYQKDKKKLKINEEELFDEIISLEEQLNSFIESKQKKEEEINELKSQIKNYERRKSSKNRRNEFDFILRRFTALYKNIQVNRRAVAGLLNLSEEQQIKAEECIFLLDRDQEKVTIKRKVFSGKKHKTACLEVLFAYNGRLYFRKNENNSIEILIIGTKNTQTKDMKFLHSL